MNAFQGLIHQTTTLEVPLADEVLALFLLGSLPETWETLVVTLSNAGPEGKHLSLNEEARRKDRETGVALLPRACRRAGPRGSWTKE